MAPSSAVKIVGCWRTTGSCKPRPQGGDRRSGRIEAFAEEIIGWVRADVDMTLAEIAERLSERHDETFKKDSCASEQERPDIGRGAQGLVQGAGKP